MNVELIVWKSETESLNLTGSCLALSRDFKARNLERLQFTLYLDSPSSQLQYLKVGNRVELKVEGEKAFEGALYERRLRELTEGVEVDATAYNDLIQYERHVVYRSYPTGTLAGEIIRDLAALIEGVNTDNVEDGDELLAPWTIENQTALSVMRATARAVNYWLRMKPGKILYFKPKTPGTPTATIDESKAMSATYSEDRWELKNRVIYIGAGGEVLADVSEGDGDLPVIVHDPFLSSREEAQRRANIRLALNKEYGKELEVEMHLSAFNALGIDLGDTVTVNLPNLGLDSVEMAVLGIEYVFGVQPRVRLKIGGIHQLFEEFLADAIGSQVAARFGKTLSKAEETSTLVYSLDAAIRAQGEERYVRYWDKPPLTIYNAQNITLDDEGHAGLISGATSGSFEAQILPPSHLFIGFLDVAWSHDPGDGSIVIRILRSDDSEVKTISGDEIGKGEYWFDRLPRKSGEWFEGAASSWGGSGATALDVTLGILHPQNLKLLPDTLGTEGEIYYPSSKDAAWNLSWAKFLMLYLYGSHPNGEDFNIKIRLHTDAENYYEGTINVKHGTWRKYEVLIPSLSQVGSPSLNNINWISIISPYELLIDGDYVFLPLTRELVRVKFELSRPSTSDASPKIRWVKIGWREGT